MNLLDSIANLVSAGRQASQTAGAWALAEAAYHARAGLEGIIVAATGATPTAADDNASTGILELVRLAGEGVASAALTCESLSQSSGTIALNLRAVERFFARLRGEPLKDVLEG